MGLLIRYHESFEKHYKRLPQNIKNTAKAKEPIFRQNPFYPALRTHKLSGKEEEVWAWWINYRYRIKFVFLNSEEVLFLDVGTHEIYK